MSPVCTDDVAGSYRRWFPMLQRKCQRMLGDRSEAQDVALEAFERLWRHRDAVTDPDRIIAWLYTTSTRLAVDRLRARRPEATEDDLPASSASIPERIVAARASIARVAAALEADDLQLLILWRVDGLGQRELAELRRTSERTIRRRLQHIKERLSSLETHDG